MSTQPRKEVLPNGVTILVDEAPYFAAGAFAFCLLGGSQEETPESSGITHLLEHLLFKQTARRSVRDIAESIDEFGGEINALTDTDSLCLYGTVPGSVFSDSFQLGVELLRESTWTEELVALERDVIRQEILEADEAPFDALYQSFCRRFWEGSMLAYPVFGLEENLDRISAAALFSRRSTLLEGRRLIVSAAGWVTMKEVVGLVERAFSDLPIGERPIAPLAPQHFGRVTVPRNSSQGYLFSARPWPGLKDPDYLLGLILTSILGQGSSSRLFQLLREEHALTYDIDVSIDGQPERGALVVSGAFDGEQLNFAHDLITAEFSRFVRDGVTPREFERTVRSFRAQLEMEGDTLRGRLWRLIDSEQYFGRYVGVEEILERVNSLTLSAVPPFLERWGGLDKEFVLFGGDVEET